ncbi:MAG: 3-deoxy-D-manno-octulosonic acid transferase [Bacteroidales bacterium]|jgi:3-deoxy-D-manno-octulosonic-acid transferase|nr:3-deoxy-D-manno-octulosonic acid transferase [Bacteroidales bacterium]
MHLLYNLGIRIFLLAVHVASLFNTKARKWINGRKNIFDDIRHFSDGQKPVAWFHCASLGEFEQGRPVIEAFRLKYPQYRILLTFFSPSGFEVRKNYTHTDHICYLPADTPGNARRFVEIVNPAFVVFVKYEYWLNYINEITVRNIPMYILSATFRTDQFFFKWYGKWSLKSLKKITRFFVQTEESAKLLEKHGISQITVTGDTRFDRVSTIAREATSLPVIEQFTESQKIMIVAGSTWQPDELLLSKLLNEFPEKFKLIIAPHEIHESHLKTIEHQFSDNTVRYSTLPKTGTTDSNVLIIDSIGMLSKLYRYAKITYIGGGFGAGIHNILEAAVYGVPVVFGPNHHKFQEALDLIASGGAYAINSYEGLKKTILNLSDNINAWQKSADASNYYVAGKCGATAKVMTELEKDLL